MIMDRYDEEAKKLRTTWWEIAAWGRSLCASRDTRIKELERACREKDEAIRLGIEYFDHRNPYEAKMRMGSALTPAAPEEKKA